TRNASAGGASAAVANAERKQKNAISRAGFIVCRPCKVNSTTIFLTLHCWHQEINREMLRSFRMRNVSLTILFPCAISMKGKWR
ncbi:MAG TPA: hypothetical protein VIW67_16390, partial [Terriglobales bacterium]